MEKITIKLIKYFMLINIFILAISLISSSIFLYKFYLEQQYNSLQSSAENVYNSLITDKQITDTDISGILINGNTITPLTHGKMGMMPFLRSASENNFKTKGVFQNGMGAEFLYYKLQTDLGDIVVFQNNKYSSDYLRVIYIILFFIFISAVLLSIPLISYVGKKFTRPILKLQKVASSISKGDFDVDCIVNTNDEIETLSENLSQMAVSLKKKYQLQRDFIANVSHDFKTPLSVIRSYSEAVSDGIIDEKNTKKYAYEIIKEVDRLNSLVMDLLQLSKLQDGAYSLSKEFINLSDLVSECVNQFTPIISKKNISTDISVKHVEIYADRKYLQRVLYNFIDNALKFSLENSKIEIYTTVINDSLKLSVKDYGIGIEQHLLEDIWDKYYKNSQSGGMGLGLPICREILKIHDFEYGAKSSANEGTEFYFIIPKYNIRTLNI
ncbi:HAMP domain-containing histidine kinase [Clostridium sp. SYSU_GA19001]|uniref:sensor histidine kinase n=1 Tax=Clostridium caldaquaticum TaxID=2940653 RepID=UPI00207762D7|nr:HAMP domain-containing sensor histidine kinase [Clostridium caldaquaticum]MCM8711675.1 HAMP domain-containing histidine kinase [Clostridium caldaquaticum]